MTEDQRFWIGTGVAAVIAVAIAAMQVNFHPGASRQNFVRFVTYSSLLLMAVVALAIVVRMVLPSSEKTSTLDRPSDLAARISQKDWVLEGESCATDAIKLALEEDDLVAYPRGAPAIRHRILSRDGQQLTTRLNTRLVIFQVSDDGFTYLDGGFGRWYHQCG